MADENLAETVQCSFSMYGLTLSRKLSAWVAKQLQSVEEDQQDSWLTKIAEAVLDQKLRSPYIELETLKLAIEECVKPNTLKNTETVLNVINAFDIPKVKHSLVKQKFVLESTTLDLYPEAQFKTEVFKNRFELPWYRTLRHPLFSPLRFGEKKENKIELVTIEFLLSESRKGYVCLMGLLTQLTEGQFYLEDTGGSIKVDLKKALKDGFLMEASVVIASGDYKDGILHVDNIAFPPAEASLTSRADFGNANTFGGPHDTSLKFSEKLKLREEENADEMIIFVSEMWLDDTVVLQKFKTMLEGYADSPPIAFVLCGHFLSFSANSTSVQKLKEGFGILAEMIIQFPEIQKTSKFIFVPAPDDIGSPKILPRAPLPKHITEDFKKNVPGAIFTTNPCRIQYCTKEIVVIREDVLTKMCRNTINFPTKGNIYDHFAKSIICQSHLTPISLSTIPVYWKYDHALQLYPTPDLIVVADQFQQYETTYMDCKVINPGLFPKNEYSFKAYVPSKNEIEECAIPKDADDI